MARRNAVVVLPAARSRRAAERRPSGSGRRANRHGSAHWVAGTRCDVGTPRTHGLATTRNARRIAHSWTDPSPNIRRLKKHRLWSTAGTPRIVERPRPPDNNWLSP